MSRGGTTVWPQARQVKGRVAGKTCLEIRVPHEHEWGGPRARVRSPAF